MSNIDQVITITPQITKFATESALTSYVSNSVGERTRLISEEKLMKKMELIKFAFKELPLGSSTRSKIIIDSIVENDHKMKEFYRSQNLTELEKFLVDIWRDGNWWKYDLIQDNIELIKDFPEAVLMLGDLSTEKSVQSFLQQNITVSNDEFLKSLGKAFSRLSVTDSNINLLKHWFEAMHFSHLALLYKTDDVVPDVVKKVCSQLNEFYLFNIDEQTQFDWLKDINNYLNNLKDKDITVSVSLPNNPIDLLLLIDSRAFNTNALNTSVIRFNKKMLDKAIEDCLENHTLSLEQADYIKGSSVSDLYLHAV